MDIYNQKSQWKIYLAIAGVFILAVSMLYTNYLAKKLAEEERKKIDNWALATQKVSEIFESDSPNTDLTLHTAILESNTTIPIIVVNDRGGISEGRNFGEKEDTDTTYLRRELRKIIAEGRQPIELGMGGGYLFYKNSTILTLVNLLPIVQFILIGAFIGFGYIGFSNARRAEQNQVWVGMAKETAHQLGTPISAILAWIEHLRMMNDGDENTTEILDELDKDVDRLELIADRFSKIGSSPVLVPINIYAELEECREYMQRRSPRKVKFDFPGIDPEPIMVNINAPLFDWVIENLLRNSLDAMDGIGEISAIVFEDRDNVYIDVSDTGKGIPQSKFKRVFQPGYTTKKRGWGLGLSLAKRIIEEYHKGKISVKRSEPGKSTTFGIKLPKSKG
jgi:signal transduction histidine kinase